MEIRRLIESKRPDLVVNKTLERRMRISDTESSQYFETVRVRSFDDLQALGIAPPQLAEGDVRKAIADDDLEALRAAHQRCDGACGSSASTGRTLRAVYADIRKAQHPHLARVFADQAGRPHSCWDSVSVRVLGGAMARLAIQELEVSLMLVSDIVVQTNATLVIDPGVSLLRAQDIRLYVGAKLVLPAPYVKVVCRSVKGDLV